MYLAIDIGGTKTLLALFSPRGRLIKKHRFPTPHDADRFIFELSEALQPFQNHKVTQIVVAIPGTVHKKYSFSFGNRDWLNLDLFSPIKKLFNCPVQFFNDANLATIYETKKLLGRSIYLTFSTGIGGGIAENGHLMTRLSNRFEPGHHPYIWDGQKLEWEDIASAAAIGSHYQTIATSIRGRKTYADIAARLSLGLTDIIKDYHPDTIVIGGPLALLFPHFIRPLKRDLRARLASLASTTAVPMPKLIAAERPQESVIYGCLLIAQETDGYEK